MLLTAAFVLGFFLGPFTALTVTAEIQQDPQPNAANLDNPQ